MIDFKIDYAQFSFNARVVMPVASFEEVRKKSNLPFYKVMTRYQTGVVVYEGNPNSDKKLAVCSGAVCDLLNIGKGFIEESRNWQATYSRLDIAMTTDQDILQKVWNDRKHVVSQKFSDCKQIMSVEESPETIIFGDMSKRSKKGMVRCYDKALQLGLAGVTLHRIEVENRRNDAEIAAKRIERGAPLASVMNSKFRIDRKWYRDLMTSEVATQRFVTEKVEISEIEKKMAWLHKQVVPSLQWVIEYDRIHGTANFKSLIDRLDVRHV